VCTIYGGAVERSPITDCLPGKTFIIKSIFSQVYIEYRNFGLNPGESTVHANAITENVVFLNDK